jgi:hypothetical protein
VYGLIREEVAVALRRSGDAAPAEEAAHA